MFLPDILEPFHQDTLDMFHQAILAMFKQDTLELFHQDLLEVLSKDQLELRHQDLQIQAFHLDPPGRRQQVFLALLVLHPYKNQLRRNHLRRQTV